VAWLRRHLRSLGPVCRVADCWTHSPPLRLPPPHSTKPRGIRADHGVTTALAVDQAPAEPSSAITSVRGWWPEEIGGSTGPPVRKQVPSASPRLRPVRPRHGTPSEPGAVRKVVTMVIAGVVEETDATLPRVPGPQ
jgi:hypothetical protein